MNPPAPQSIGNLRGAIDLAPLVNRANAPRPPAGAPASGATGGPTAGAGPTGDGVIRVPSLVLEGTDANFGQVLELSKQVPIVIDLWAEWSEPCKELSPILERVVTGFGGRLLLVTVDVDANPQLAQAFQAQSVPTVAALVGGRPISLFVGALPEAQVGEVFDQLLALAQQNGVTQSVTVEGVDPSAPPAEPIEEPLPPHHAEAYAAIEQGDYATAIAEYKTAIAQDPRDSLAVAGLAQVQLLSRLAAVSATDVRAAAAADPTDLAAQLDVADLDLSGGHVDDAFGRLLDLFPRLDAASRESVRNRLVEYFEVIGTDDPRVIAARRRLASLLY
ncbi:tetratricopeptide repeat protein [Naasia lichenicola]|uniref:Tetratricopeptide repeat protein n=1 Tax=Naasia lichenicola TaxID=2565933 RepID=A0A4S4FNB2_9MICO|nr:tetratricopeptide repeat protein [Naasia lichenicola]THG31714.1 tetratricopeptide repeat protein [Naasia lichenicola]